MDIRVIVTVLVALFVAGNVITEAANIRTLSPLTQPMSGYLAGVRLAWVQDAGFAALVVALFILGAVWWPLGVFGIVAGIALALVVITKYITAGWRLKVHIASAGVAFLGVTALMLAKSRIDSVARFAAIAGVGVTFLAWRFARKSEQGPIEEKLLSIALMASVLAELWIP